MKKLMKMISLVLCILFASAGCKSGENTGDPGNPNPPGNPPPDNGTSSLSYIYKPGDGGYSCFRIPAIVKAKDGTLLAFAEARKNNCSDEENIDLVVKRSSDGGETWGKMAVVWNDGENTCGNPAPVVDAETGRVHLLMTWNLGTDKIGTINNGTSKDTRRVFYTYSDDNGITWKPAEEITGSVKNAVWGWYATGPGHGVQLTKGTYKNRLIIPCDYIEVGTGRKGYSHVIYSDDNGNTWKLGGISPAHPKNPNESTAAELSDGKVMLNMRNSSNNRLVSVSSDGGETFPSIQPDYGLIDPVCQGSLLNTEIKGAHTLFFSNPSSTSRETMTIKMSINDGKNWTKRYVVHQGPSAYSDLVMLNENEIGILFEGGKSKPYEGIAFEAVNIEKLK